MPFKSGSQKRFLWANHPDIARRWAHKSPDKSKDLPERVRSKTAGVEIRRRFEEKKKEKVAALEKAAKTRLIKNIELQMKKMKATPMQVATRQVRVPLLEHAIERGALLPGSRRSIAPLGTGTSTSASLVLAPTRKSLLESGTLTTKDAPKFVVKTTPKVNQRRALKMSDAEAHLKPADRPTTKGFKASRSTREGQVRRAASRHKLVQTAHGSDPILRELGDISKLVASEPRAQWSTFSGPFGRGKQKKLLSPGTYFTVPSAKVEKGTITPTQAARTAAYAAQLRRRHGIVHEDPHWKNVLYQETGRAAQGKPHYIDFDLVKQLGQRSGGGGRIKKVPEGGFQIGKPDVKDIIDNVTGIPMVGGKGVDPRRLVEIKASLKEVFARAEKGTRLNQKLLDKLIKDIAAGKTPIPQYTATPSGRLMTAAQVRKARATTAR